MPALLLANPYVDIILALALAWLSLKIVQALFGPLHSLPGVGGLIAQAEHAIAQSLSSACGGIASGASAAVGSSLHAIARLVEHSAAAFKRPAVALLEAATLIGSIVAAIHALKALVHRAVGTVSGVLPRVKRLEKEYHGIEHRVKTLEREIAGGIGHDLRIRIEALERWEKGAQAELKADAKAITQTLPGLVADLKSFIKVLPGTSYLEWAAGIVTAALGLEIFRMLKCPSLLRSATKRGCGMWDGLESLLGMFVDVFLFTHFCDLWGEAEPIFAAVLDPVVGVISTFADGACSHRPGGWESLNVPTLETPTADEITATLIAG